MNKIIFNRNYIDAQKWSFLNYIATINLVFILVGFSFSSSLLIPFGVNPEFSQIINLPYRIIAILLSSACSVLCVVGRRKLPEFPFALKIFYFGFLLISIRIFIDLNSSLYVGVENETPFKVYGIVLYTLIASLSVYFSYYYIKYDHVVFITLIVSSYIMILRPLGFGNTAEHMLLDTTMTRESVGSLFSISLGYLGVTAFFLALYNIFNRNYSILYKIISIIVSPLALYTIIISGSRSPFLVLFMVLVLYIASFFRFYILVFLVLGIGGVISYFIRFQIVGILKDIAPLLGSRLESMFLDKYISGRDVLVELGIDVANKSPIVGSTILQNGRTLLCGYHSAFIDAIAYLGYIAGGMIILLYVCIGLKSFNLLLNRNCIYNKYWIILLFFVYYFYSVFAGTLYYCKESLAAIMVLAIVMSAEFSKNNYNKL